MGGGCPPDIFPHSLVFIDLDGTLVNTDKANNEAYLFAIQEFGLKLKVVPSRITRSNLPFDSETNNKIVNRKEQIYSDFVPLTTVNQEYIPVLENNYFNFLISLAKRNRVMTILKYHNLDKFFTLIFTEVKNKLDYICELYVQKNVILFDNELVGGIDHVLCR